MISRAKHMRNAKKRARDEYKFYKDRGDPDAIQNAAGAMLSELRKHPETVPLLAISFAMMNETVKDEKSLFAFIDGFAE